MHPQPTFFFFLPLIVSVACPTGPHPPLRLARRPNIQHVASFIPHGRTSVWSGSLVYRPMCCILRVYIRVRSVHRVVAVSTLFPAVCQGRREA